MDEMPGDIVEPDLAKIMPAYEHMVKPPQNSCAIIRMQPMANGWLIKSRMVNGALDALSESLRCISVYEYFNFDISYSNNLFSDAADCGDMLR